MTIKLEIFGRAGCKSVFIDRSDLRTDDHTFDNNLLIGNWVILTR